MSNDTSDIALPMHIGINKIFGKESPEYIFTIGRKHDAAIVLNSGDRARFVCYFHLFW